MKIIRWLLSHFFLILLIVVVIYGYMFWGNLAGENTPAGKALAYLSSEFVEVEEFINAVKAKQAQLSAGPSSVEPSSAGDSESQAEISPQTEAAMAYNQNRQIAEPSFTTRRGEAVQNKAPALAPASPSPSAPALAAAGMADTQDEFVSTEVAQQLDNVDKHGNVINRSLQGDAVRESWVTARKSFYQRKYELSEQSYQDVIANTTDNFDAYGELGNVYFNQGKNEKAAAAYYEAASILVRKGEIRRAKSLMGLLRHLDNSKAVDLQKLIESPVS